MMSKGAYVKSLENVKLVLGNGFDLHCKLYSTYWHYYLKNKNKYNYIQKWLSDYLDDANYFMINSNTKKVDSDSLNVWDYYFALLMTIDKESKNHLWSDIEKIIQQSLYSEDSKNFPLSWPFVYRIINGPLNVRDTYPLYDALSAATFILHENEAFSSEEEFYEFVLSELKKFEKTFGSFIFDQHKNINRRYIQYGLLNERYMKCAAETVEWLCDIDKVSSIDTFNYVGTGIESIDKKIRFINGNYNNPIFGIETSLPPNDPKFIFTKVNRRISDEMDNEMFSKFLDFNNLVVYGHSLGEFDYNYFFPMLDKIRIADSNHKGVFVYAYTVFDENKRHIIEKNVRNRVYQLIYKYAESRGLHKDIIESVSIQKRIIFYEIPELTNREFAYPNHFDDKDYLEDDNK